MPLSFPEFVLFFIYFFDNLLNVLINRLVHAKICEAIFVIFHVLLDNILGRLGWVSMFAFLDGISSKWGSVESKLIVLPK